MPLYLGPKPLTLKNWANTVDFVDGGIDRKTSVKTSKKHVRKVTTVAIVVVCLVAATASAALAQRSSEMSPPWDAALAPQPQAATESAPQRSLATARPDFSPSIAAARRTLDASPGEVRQVYVNTFSEPTDANRVDSFVHYRDPFVVNETLGASDHASTGGVNCSAPEFTRVQTRDQPHGHVYQCFPAGDPALGHMMGFAMDTSGYGFVGGLPDQVFDGVHEIAVDINTTTAGVRNFVEIKVLPASETYVNAMPCGPDLPCNDGWDYDDIGGVGASTSSQDGTGLQINTPVRPDGYTFDRYNRTTSPNGDIEYGSCDDNENYCFTTFVHGGNSGIRERYRHIFRDNGNGTLSFGIAEGDITHWVTSPGAFPDGPTRVVIAFHTYTGTKGDDGPGFDGNLSPSEGGFTWHWDNLVVSAETALPAEDFFGGHSADRIVTPNGCIAFSQGQRANPHDTDIAPQLLCEGDGI